MATKMKRFLAILMALTLCASLIAVPAMATETEEAAPAATEAPAAAPAAEAAPAAPVSEVATPNVAPAAVEITMTAKAQSALWGPGGNQGSNQGGNQGSNQGGNQGGNWGGNQGGNQGSTPDENTAVDHIDINVNAGGTVIIDGVEQNVSVGVDKNDADNVTITNKGEEGYDDFSVSGDVSTSTDANGESQIRIEGSFDIGTQENPTSYTVELVKDVTVGEGDKTQNITVTLSTTTDYWDLENLCPQLWSGDTPNSSWQNGKYVGGSGIDLKLKPAGSSSNTPENPEDPETPAEDPTNGQLTIQKTVIGFEDGLPEDMNFYFDVTDDAGNVVYDDVAVKVTSGNTVGLLIIENVEFGTYTVIEIVDERTDISGYDLDEEAIEYLLKDGSVSNTVVIDVVNDEGYIGIINEYIAEETQPEETQPEEPKPEETQPEEPKPEETQPEEPKPEEPKPEEPKPEETQPEEPKPEEPKPEEPKPEEPKPEETQPEEPKPEEPKPEET